MSVSQIGTGALPGSVSAGGRFFLAGALEFAGTLKLGQVLKARVLRHFEGNRYLADFGGNERVVDSAVPLSTGEILYGRVVGLGERVELQRIHDLGARPVSGDSAAVSSPALPAAGSLEQLLDRTMNDYRLNLGESERSALLAAARKAGDPSTMLQAGAYLNKLSLGQHPELLTAIYTRLVRDDGRSSRNTNWSSPPELSAEHVAGTLDAGSLKQLSTLLENALDPDGREKSREEGQDGDLSVGPSGGETEAAVQALSARQENNGRSRDELFERMASWLLNAQGGGSVSHRLGSIPFLLNGRLIEVDMALFEQGPSPRQAVGDNTHHRRIVLSLNLESLGRVDVEATVAGENLRLRILSDDSSRSAAVADHAQALRRALGDLGWDVDEIRYESRLAGQGGQDPARSVLEHMISLDSFNRLV